MAQRRLGPADAIFEAALAHGDTPVHRTYCSLLYEKTQPTDFEDKARIYGLTEWAQSVAKYVEGKNDLEGFLPLKEHERYRHEYGLTA